MGEWTWLHVEFPVADIELVSRPIDPKAANVLVRTIRRLADDSKGPRYEIRVAPHNVSPFKGGPWLRQFTHAELDEPGDALYAFRAYLAEQVDAARNRTTQ